MILSIIISIIAIAVLCFAAVMSLITIKNSRTRVSWMLIAIAFVFMAVSQVLEIYQYQNIEGGSYYRALYPWVNLVVAALMAIGVWQIDKILKTLKRSESQKRASENRFRELFNNSSDEIFLADFDGNIIEVNQTAVQRLGFTREELMKKNFADLKTAKYLPLVKPNLEKILANRTHVYDSEHVARDGTVVALEMSSRVIDYFGKPAILTIARDITERREMERKIVSAILQTEERERRRFATDLHDGLAPILSTIKLYADLIKKGNFKKISMEEALQSLEELTDHAIKSSREISNNIMPSILQDFGLAVAIRDFCNYVNNTQSLQIATDTEHYPDVRPGIEETILFQAVKELVNNTIKHSGAQHAEVFLESHDGQINLFYKDDGIGFEPEKKLQDSSGLGLNSIVSKVETIKGKCLIKSAPGEGMTVLITLDRKG
jgi:PAS domain S-box-containing protein